MYRIALALAAGLSLAAPGAASAHDQVRSASQIFAAEMDTDRDGMITRAELEAFSDDVFASMDSDGDGVVEFHELRDWEHGHAAAAAHVGVEEAYVAALSTLFGLYDRDGDAIITADEHGYATLASARFADADEDGKMSHADFVDGYLANAVLVPVFAR